MTNLVLRDMTPARGDSKPCTHEACIGRMHYARNQAGDLHWVCDRDPSH